MKKSCATTNHNANCISGTLGSGPPQPPAPPSPEPPVPPLPPRPPPTPMVPLEWAAAAGKANATLAQMTATEKYAMMKQVCCSPKTTH